MAECPSSGNYVKGADILIKVLPSTALDQTGATFSEYVAVAGQQNATFTRGSENFSYNVKGDNWTYNEATYRSWEISAEGLYVYDDTAFEELNQAFINGDDVLVEVCFDSTETVGSSYYYGCSIISDFSMEMPQDNMVSYNITLMGKGELIEGTIT